MKAPMTEWVLVPREPSQEMVDAWPRHNHGAGHERDIYRAMIAASPTPPPRDGEGDLVARLQKLGEWLDFDFGRDDPPAGDIAREAATAIESLSRQLEEAREALTGLLSKLERADEGLANAYSGAGSDERRNDLACERIGMQRAIEIARRAKETVSHG